MVVVFLCAVLASLFVLFSLLPFYYQEEKKRASRFFFCALHWLLD